VAFLEKRHRHLSAGAVQCASGLGAEALAAASDKS
jgi:hypothetical protein